MLRNGSVINLCSLAICSEAKLFSKAYQRFNAVVWCNKIDAVPSVAGWGPLGPPLPSAFTVKQLRTACAASA